MLGVAHDGLEHEGEQEPQHGGALQAGGAGRAAHREEQDEGGRQEQVHRDHVDPRDQQRVELVARRAGVAGVRARAGHHGAQVHGGPRQRERRPRGGTGPDGGGAVDEGHARPAGAALGGDAHDEQGRHGHHDRGHDEVTGHPPRVQMRQDHDAAHEGLRGDAGQQAHGEPEGAPVGAAQVPQGQEHGGGDDHQDERQRPVAELDVAVDAHLRGVGEGLGRALGPRGAAQAGTGEAHGAAGDDDADLGRQGRHGEGHGGLREALRQAGGEPGRGGPGRGGGGGHGVLPIVRRRGTGDGSGPPAEPAERGRDGHGAPQGEHEQGEG